MGIMAMTAVGPDGRMLLGPDGKPLQLGPDRVKLVTANGRPLLSDRGTQLGLAPDGETAIIRGTLIHIHTHKSASAASLHGLGMKSSLDSRAGFAPMALWPRLKQTMKLCVVGSI